MGRGEETEDKRFVIISVVKTRTQQTGDFTTKSRANSKT